MAVGRSGVGRTGTRLRSGLTVALIAASLLVLGGGVAQAHVVFAHGRAYGVTYRSRPGQPLRFPNGRAAPLTVGGQQPLLLYGGGPLMLSSKLYLIFWEQKAGEFETGYTEPIIQYAKDLKAEQAHTTNEFSIAEQYTDKTAQAITGKIEFGGEVMVTGAYPALNEKEGCTKAKAPCVTDAQIRTEILEQIEANHWPTDTPGAPEAQYLLYTPKGVASCEFGECAPEEFCAYHSEITKIGTEKRVAVYSDLPYVAECDSGQAPSGVAGNKDADGTLDSEIHEIIESATDPAPPLGYTDRNGEEIADKCTEPVVELQPEVYGTPLGGSLGEDTAFNQLINGHSYYTQQVWSNAPTVTPKPGSEGEPAGCAARIGPTPSFAAPASGAAGSPIAFNGNGSYDITAPIEVYEWSFGDGSPPESAGPDPTHSYTQPGTYQVSLTVSDSGGRADASTETLPVTIAGATAGAPGASISSPPGKQTYTVGEVVASSFACADAAGGPGIASCTDSNGAGSPGRLDTSTVGAHDYTVTAVSLDGQRGTATIEYTVASSPSGSTSSTSTPSGAKPAPKLTRAQKLARAIRACKKLKNKRKRARCIAVAKKRYAPPKKKHK